MDPRNSSDQKMFKYTFAPQMENDELGVHDIIVGLRFTILGFKELRKMRDAVEEELAKLATIKVCADLQAARSDD